ncbi:hypothetical protein Tco_1211911 [Tanacetum coccineum]
MISTTISKLLNKRLKELQSQTQAQVLRIWLLCHPLAVLMKLILLMELVLLTHKCPASTQVSNASTQVSTTKLSDDTVYAFLASQPNGSQLVYEDLEQIHEDDIEEMDLKWQLALLSIRTRSYMVDDEVHRNMALMDFLDSEPEFEGYGPKTSKSVSEYISNEVRESLNAPLVKELVLDDNLEKKTVSPTVAKIEFVRPKQ